MDFLQREDALHAVLCLGISCPRASGARCNPGFQEGKKLVDRREGTPPGHVSGSTELDGWVEDG